MKTLNIMVALIICCAVLSACKKSATEGIAVEKTITDQIQIKSTALLPLLIGKDSLLNVVLLPAGATNSKLLWTSSNTEVATVDENGRVKALASGESTIEATTIDGGLRKAAIVVRAISKIEYISDIVLNSTSTSIYQGESLNLVATISPANATYTTLKWSSSNPSIATVSDAGILTTSGKGTVTITAASTDGSNIKKTISIEVKELIPVTGITINNAPSETMALGENLLLSLTLSPSNASVQALQWTTSNATAVSVSQAGLITGVAPGQATITVETKNGSGIKASFNVTVEEGKMNDTFFNGTNWRASTSGSTGVAQDGVFKVGMAGKRGDAQRIGGATVHAGKFPIIAFKFNRPLPTGGNVILDTNLGRYMQTVGNGNNQMTTIIGKDGVQVHYANIAEGSFGTGAVKLSTTATNVFTTFTAIVADFPFTDGQLSAGVNKYDLYWVKSFKTVAELQAYIAK